MEGSDTAADGVLCKYYPPASIEWLNANLYLVVNYISVGPQDSDLHKIEKKLKVPDWAKKMLNKGRFPNNLIFTKDF